MHSNCDLFKSALSPSNAANLRKLLNNYVLNFPTQFTRYTVLTPTVVGPQLSKLQTVMVTVLLEYFVMSVYSIRVLQWSK